MIKKFFYTPPKIFISYRRQDSSGHTGRMFDDLVTAFGKSAVTMDVDKIQGGENYIKIIEDEIKSAKVLLVVIGNEWLTIGENGQRRLDNPQDLVRREILIALAAKITIIPVLVQGTKMPGGRDLPDDLKPLADIHAIDLSDTRWQYDITKLVSTIRKKQSNIILWKMAITAIILALFVVVGFKFLKNYNSDISKITTNTDSIQKKLLSPLFPLEMAVTMHFKISEMRSEQQIGFWNLQKISEAGGFEEGSLSYADNLKKKVSRLTLTNMFASGSRSKGDTLSDIFSLFEPGMVFTFKKNVPDTTQKNGNSLVIRFSRRVNNTDIAHKSYCIFDFADSTGYIQLTISPVMNATNNGNFESLYDLANTTVDIQTFLGRRLDTLFSIEDVRLSTSIFKDVRLRLKKEEKTPTGYQHKITDKELGLQ